MTGLVQQTSGSSTTTSLTLTLPAPATIGNGIVLAVSGFHGSSISSITLGGTGGLFGEAAATSSTSNNAQIWLCSPVTVASASIVITAGAAGVVAYAYEVNGWVTPSTNFLSVWFDQNEWAWNTGTAWSSGATAATLNAPEFVVGIGATDGTAAVTVAGAGTGGWTNETAIQGVHAGTRFYSAVSGYQVQGAASGTYTYSGTASASAAWGAATATFLLMPTFDNWGGYVFSEHASYTGVSATFTIPSLTGETGSVGSIWVGLGDVYQCGVNLEYNTGFSGNVFTGAWSEWVPGGFENWNLTAYPTAAGDSITASVQLTATSWLMTITNNTRSWTYTSVKSVLAVNIGQLASPAVWPYPLTTAEVIIEDEGNEKTPAAGTPEYGTVAFTSVATTPAISQAPQAWATLNTDIDQYPGPFTLGGGGGSFTMFWNNFT